MNRHQMILSYVATLGFLLVLAAPAAGGRNTSSQDQDAQADSRAQQEFNRGVTAYAAVHDRAEADLPHINASRSGAEIVQRQHTLAARIQAAQLAKAAREGAIFTPGVSAYFRRQIQAAYLANGAGIQATLEMTPTVEEQQIVVNQPYPADASHSVVPPTILLRLPRLPPWMQYDIVNRDLVIRDTECNLVVDVMRNVIP